MLSRHLATQPSIRRLITLERSGRYEEALELFGEGWLDVSYLPDETGLSPEEYRETLLRFGSLIGFYGFKHAIPESQERSRNILTAVREQFVESGDLGKIAECETYISLSYWRSGEFREALVWIKEALSRDLPVSSSARLYAEVVRSLIFLNTGQQKENIANCLAVEQEMRSNGDAFLNGSLCTNLALSYKRLAQNAKAMQYLSLARYFHEKSRHKTYLGTVHNNLAQLYKAEQKFESAHESADAAIKIYKKTKDRTREASTWDTKAQIYLAESKFPDALAMANKSIKLLQAVPGSADLAESLLTKAKILLLSDEFSEAILSLVDAVNITRIQNGDDAAKCLIEEFEAAFDKNQTPRPVSPTINSDELELVLPASLSGYEDYKGVWIKTEKLERAGVPRGALAIVVPGEVIRGDLIAVLQLKDRIVSCGFYDSEFGIICLESDNHEPELFDDTEVRILGKIIGVCRTGKDADGKMQVESLAS